MTRALWTADEIIAATGGQLDLPTQKTGGPEGVPPVGCGAGPADREAVIAGISIDTRTLSPGDLFVPLTDVRDGHDFVAAAFERGAIVALVRMGYERKSGDGALIRVPDVGGQGLRPCRPRAHRHRRPRPTFRRRPRDRRDWLGRQDRHEGDAARLPEGVRLVARQSPRAREIIQQPLGRAAHPRPHARRHRVRRLRDRHESCGRDPARSPGWFARISPSLPTSFRSTSATSPTARSGSPTPRPRSSRGWKPSPSPRFMLANPEEGRGAGTVKRNSHHPPRQPALRAVASSRPKPRRGGAHVRARPCIGRHSRRL